MKRYVGEEINIPPELECVLMKGDTISVRMSESKYKYIIFFDSLSCSSCAIKQLPRWLNIVNYAADNPERLSLYFIFESKHEFVDFNRESLLLSDIYYPLFLDTSTFYRKANPEIVDQKVNYLMVDSLNKIVFIGDVLRNKRLFREFNEILND